MTRAQLHSKENLYSTVWKAQCPTYGTYSWFWLHKTSLILPSTAHSLSLRHRIVPSHTVILGGHPTVTAPWRCKSPLQLRLSLHQWPLQVSSWTPTMSCWAKFLWFSMTSSCHPNLDHMRDSCTWPSCQCQQSFLSCPVP